MTARQNFDDDVVAFGGPTEEDRVAVAVARIEDNAEREARWRREAEAVQQSTEATIAERGRPGWEPEPPADGWDEVAAGILERQSTVNRTLSKAGLHGAGQEEVQSLPDRLRASLIRGDDVLTIPPPVPLIADLLDLDSLAVLYGPSGSKKTFVALDWALSIGTGSWWLGHEVLTGPVLYVAAEGVSGLGIRVRAWQEHHRVHSCGDVAWLPIGVNLLHPHSTSALVEIVAELQPRLVVLDTLARCLVGGDENTAKDVGLAVEAADHVRRASGACVLLVHHSGKDVAAGARGSSALKGAMSTEIECTADDSAIVLRTTKVKEHGEVQPIRLALVRVADSCALDRYRGSAGLPDGALELLAELAAIDTGDGVSSSTWRLSSGVAERSFYRWQKGLVDEGYCQKDGEKAQARFTITEQGKQALAGE